MALDFNGSTDRVDYGAAWDPSGSALTIAAWIYPDNVSTLQRVLEIHASGDAADGCALWMVNTQLGLTRAWSGADAYHYRHGTGELASGSWQHVLATSDSGADNSGMECYVDGAVPGTSGGGAGSGSEDAHSGSWSIGGRKWEDTRNFEGRIAEVGVWDRELSADEIAALVTGYAPLCFLRGLRFYAPLMSRGVEVVAGVTPTLDGTNVIAHPKAIYPV